MEHHQAYQSFPETKDPLQNYPLKSDMPLAMPVNQCPQSLPSIITASSGFFVSDESETVAPHNMSDPPKDQFRGVTYTDRATICVGINVEEPESSTKQPHNLENVINDLNSQLDSINTEIRDEISGLSTAPEDEADAKPSTPTQVAPLPLPDFETTSRLVDQLFPETARSPDRGQENQLQHPGLTIEELEPITVFKPKRKAKRNNSQKDESKRKKKGENSTAPESDFGSSSNLLSLTTQTNKSRSSRASRKKSAPNILSFDEQTLIARMAVENSQPSSQEDPTTNSKLLSELQRLLTQNNIRSALQGERKRKKARPSLDSPPYIQPPHTHDSTSLDGSRFNIDKPQMYPCLQCNKEFKTKQCLKRHISRHLGVKMHVCSYCNKRFNDKSNMKRHVVTHINVRAFECDVCDQAFYRKEVMELHKRRKHTIPEDILNCRFKKCSFVCKVPFALVEHIQTVHFNNYKHTCDECGYRTQHNVNYLKHLRKHTGERPLKCPKCGKGFKQDNSLKRHMAIHLERPYKCEICLKTFLLDLALRIHYENNHGPRAAQRKLHEKRKREILKRYRQQRSVHSKKLSFVDVLANKL